MLYIVIEDGSNDPTFAPFSDVRFVETDDATETENPVNDESAKTLDLQDMFLTILKNDGVTKEAYEKMIPFLSAKIRSMVSVDTGVYYIKK